MGCYNNPENKNFRGNDGAKKEGGASAATLNLDPSDLLLQLGQTEVLHRGSASMTMGVTTTVLNRKDDTLAADGEHGLGEHQHTDG
jgi:hypothetical protein